MGRHEQTFIILMFALALYSFDCLLVQPVRQEQHIAEIQHIIAVKDSQVDNIEASVDSLCSQFSDFRATEATRDKAMFDRHGIPWRDAAGNPTPAAEGDPTPIEGH